MKKDAILLIENFDLLEKKIIIFIDQDKNYNKFYINKKNGGKREILSPSKDLFVIQKTLLNYIVNVYTPTKNSFAYIKHRSIVQNASFHTNKNFVFNIDLKDFFKSITKDMFKKSFLLNYDFNIENEHLLNYVLKYCFYDDYLPQGAPTSPVLSNICCIELDKNLSKLAEKFELDYTRYADDITFSGNENVFYKKNEFRKKLYEIIINNGFNINEKKISLNRKDKRQVVTGLVVNKKVNVPKNYIKNIRLYLYWWEKFGYNEAQNKFHSHKDFCSSKTMNFSLHINGLLNFISSVLGNKSNVYLKLKSRFEKLYDLYLFNFDYISSTKKLIYQENGKSINSISRDTKRIYEFNKDLSENISEEDLRVRLHLESLKKRGIGKIIFTHQSGIKEEINIEDYRQESLKDFLKNTSTTSAEKLYKISFRVNKFANTNETIRELAVLGIRTELLNNNTAVESAINELLKNSLKLSQQEIDELSVVKKTIQTPLNDQIIYNKENIDFEEVVAILGSNDKLKKALEDKGVWTDIVAAFLQSGIKTKSASRAISVKDFYSLTSEGKKTSRNIVSNSLNKVSSMFIEAGNSVSEEDLVFSEIVDNLKENDTVELVYDASSKVSTENVNTTRTRFNAFISTFKESIPNSLSPSNLMLRFNTMIPEGLDLNEEGLGKLKDLKQALIDYETSEITFEELIDQVLEIDKITPTFRLNGTKKTIPQISRTYGFKESNHYNAITKKALNGEDSNDGSYETILLGSIEGLIYRLALQRLHIKYNEPIEVEISKITSSKLLHNKFDEESDPSKPKVRFLTNNEDLFTEDELKSAIVNKSIPTYVYEKDGLKINVPELFFTPNVGIGENRFNSYMYQLLKGLNPDVEESRLKFFVEQKLQNVAQTTTIKTQTKVIIIRNNSIDSKAEISSHKSFDEGEIPSHIEMVERLASRVEELGIGEVKTGVNGYDYTDEKVTREEITWNQLVESLRQEANSIPAFSEKNVLNFNELNIKSNNSNLKKFPFLHLFLGTGEGENYITTSKQFSMATYFSDLKKGDAGRKITVNPLYKSSSKHNYAVLAQQLVLLTNSARTDIFVDSNQRNVPIGKRFSTTGSVMFKFEYRSMNTESSKAAEKARIDLVEKEFLKSKDSESNKIFDETDKYYSSDDIANNKEVIIPNIKSVLRNSSLIEYKIKLFKSILNHKNTKDEDGDNFFSTLDEYRFILDEDVTDDFSEEEFNLLIKLEEYILKNDLKNNYEDFTTFNNDLKEIVGRRT